MSFHIRPSRLLSTSALSATPASNAARSTLAATLRLSSVSRHFSSTSSASSAGAAGSSSMAPIPQEVDYLVIGGGSGGVASARRASKIYGAKSLVIESNRWGGTCVNVGCVPKKLTWHAADIADTIKHSKSYGFSVETTAPFNWGLFKQKRDAYVKKLNGIYEKNLDNDGAQFAHGKAKFTGKNQAEITLDDGSKHTVKGKHVLIATGGYPNVPKDIPGAELGINSDGFFELAQQPKKVAIVGAGYIAVEFAGLFHALGTETHLFIRHDNFLRPFDPVIQESIAKEYERIGIKIHRQSSQSKVEDIGNGQKKLHYKDSNGEGTLDIDTLVWAIGRTPEVKDLNLTALGDVKLNDKEHIVVDEYQNTSVDKVYSVGDVCDRGFELTPVAIAAGRRLVDRVFGGQKDRKLDYSNIPSVVFAHPEAGSIGLTEPQAREKFGDAVKVYNSGFVSMVNSMYEDGEKTRSNFKLIVQGKDEKVVGLHIVGEGSSEILQGFGVAIKMGATKADFDSVVAIHPTSAEEIVTLK